MGRYLSDLSNRFIINSGDRPDGMRGPSAPSMWGDVETEPCPVGFSRGYVERDLEEHPVASLFGSQGTDDWNKDIPLIPFEEWTERIEEMDKNKSSIEDVMMVADNGQPIEVLDQNGQGFCWAYSTAMCIMQKRALMGLPYVRLSAHSLACKIKNFKDEGGWCGLSATNAMEGKFGYVPTKYWPEKSMDRRYDSKANWEIAANFTISEGFMDLQQPIYGKTMTFQQFGSAILSRIPCCADYNWWGHSVATARLLSVSDKYPVNNPNSYGLLIPNSWRKTWGKFGYGVIVGSKWVPDGAIGVRNVTYFEAL